MIIRLSAFGAVCLLAACASDIPDSNPNIGVGFSDYDRFRSEQARRDALLEAKREAAMRPDAVIGEETLAVLAATRREAGPEQVSGTAPVTPTPAPIAGSAAVASVETTPVPAAPATDNPDISDEQNFDAVSGRQTIESDAERLERLREARQEVAPVPVPERSSSGRPNVVAYALSTSHQVGEELYRRSGFTSTSRFQRNCARFASADLAQEEFLARGGPERDRSGLDPDGDGFACFWDPRPFRAARGG